jgi:LDH2 family malate/lactate/ureidoglycolate dehydrogenase
MVDQSPTRVPAARLQTFMAMAFEKVGLPAEDAAGVAELMVRADLNGSDGHGVFRLPSYVRRIQAGGTNTRPNIRIVEERDGTALIDGDNGMGHLVMRVAAETAIAKAKKTGVAWVGARMSNHAGPASLYASMALQHDMIGLYLAVGNANHLPPWGGAEMLLSTNPIAVAIPALAEPPVILDMATTVAAYGKIKTAAQRGETIPEGWMMDREGRPLTDPTRADEGFLLPIGGYKGYALSLVFGLLAGTLNGAAMGRSTVDFNKDFETPTNTGQAIMAISVEAFGDVTGFKRNVDEIVRTMRSAKRLPGVDRIWLPGEQSYHRRQDRSKNGIPMPAALRKVLDGLADELGIERLAEPE